MKADIQEFRGLVDDFTEQQIWEAICDCNGNKAPGPDGFNILRIKKCWGVMKKDILDLFKEFQDNGKLVRGLSSSFVACVPKILGGL